MKQPFCWWHVGGWHACSMCAISMACTTGSEVSERCLSGNDLIEVHLGPAQVAVCTPGLLCLYSSVPLLPRSKLLSISCRVSNLQLETSLLMLLPYRSKKNISSTILSLSLSLNPTFSLFSPIIGVADWENKMILSRMTIIQRTGPSGGVEPVLQRSRGPPLERGRPAGANVWRIFLERLLNSRQTFYLFPRDCVRSDIPPTRLQL